MDQIRLDPQDKLSPTSWTHQQNSLPPQDKTVPVPPPPPRIISGTALTQFLYLRKLVVKKGCLLKKSKTKTKKAKYE